MGYCTNLFLISLEKLRAPYIFRCPNVSATKHGLSLFAEIQKNNTALVLQNVSFPTINLHKTRSVNSNNRTIRELFRYGIDEFIKENGKKNAIEVIDFIKKTDGQLAQTEPLRFSLKSFRGLGERGFVSDKRYFDKLYNAKVGDILVPDEGYMHMGLSARTADEFVNEFSKYSPTCRKAILELDLQPGTLISIIDEYGGEILTERSMRCMVKQKSTDANGVLHLRLENIVSAAKTSIPNV